MREDYFWDKGEDCNNLWLYIVKSDLSALGVFGICEISLHELIRS